MSHASPQGPQLPEFLNRTLAHLAAAAVISVLSFAGGYLFNPTEATPVTKINRCVPAQPNDPWTLWVAHRPPAD
jgi:hypothetical protein